MQGSGGDDDEEKLNKCELTFNLSTYKQQLHQEVRELLNDEPSKMRCLNSSTGDPPLPTLPFELVLEILYRLPVVKSLTQFKSVCKSWKELISDSKFANKHFHLSTTRNHVLLFKLAKHEYIFNVFTLSPVFTKKLTPTATHKLNRKDQRLNVFIGSCHGILCFELVETPLLLWNPSFQKFTKSPSLQIIPDRDGWRSTNTNYGFGYDHSTDTYKVVAFACTKYDTGVYKVQTHVHTMGTNFWKRIQADFPGVPICQPGKFVSGTINCLVKDSKRVIVSFDLETESYRQLLLPVVTSTFCVLRDCLSILSNSHTFSDVWLMKEYGNQDSWTKLFHVPYTGSVCFGNYTRALYVYDDDRVLLEFVGKLVVYNSRDGTFKTLRIQKYCDWMMPKMPEVFQESLISPCS